MQIGLVGLGKMGGNMRTRLRNNGIEVVGYDRDQSVADVASIEEMVKALPAPRIVWVMVPHGRPTDDVVEELANHMTSGDMIIDITRKIKELRPDIKYVEIPGGGPQLQAAAPHKKATKITPRRQRRGVFFGLLGRPRRHLRGVLSFSVSG